MLMQVQVQAAWFEISRIGVQSKFIEDSMKKCAAEVHKSLNEARDSIAGKHFRPTLNEMVLVVHCDRAQSEAFAPSPFSCGSPVPGPQTLL